ncbi:glucose-6-phosphate dehydrogenase [soil metagenome]
MSPSPQSGVATLAGSVARPGVIVLVGATGDLALRMLFASLYRLDAEGRLDDPLRIVGVARADHSRDEMLALVRQALGERLGPDEFAEARFDHFAARFDYLPSDMSTPGGALALEGWLEAAGLRDAAKVFYLAVSPKLYAPICARLGEGALVGPDDRVVLEKPIGRDLKSACELNAAVAAVFPDDRTFRIDHYLGKETVQNLIALRFANALFEPLWTSVSIDHVEITVAETEGVGDRWPYYDDYGATGDMLQNHMLQLLALIAMEPPSDLGADAVRAEKVKVFRSLRRFDRPESIQNVVRGQYGPGVVEGRQVPSYLDEKGSGSGTETFVVMRADIDNWRWAGTPFFLRTGKRMPERRTQIVVQFKPVPHSIFGQPATASLQPNRLVIDLQPQEEIRLSLMNRVAGTSVDGMELKPLQLSLGLGPSLHPGKTRRIAYERLILDVLECNRTLFVSREEVEAAWSWLDGAATVWTQAGGSPKSYPAGSWGPPAAFALIERAGREWSE